ncbi:MAG: betaine/proline/choline family ABC transporter ATP-binding protein [Actinobacteria bacterium]|nr:MAG: betaine/proline/choline family ABC transporter ATP-binding protein [Actinomycetota bacterium]
MIRLDRVTKRYGDSTVAVDDLTLEVAEGELCVLVGPSGCGKTTTMKMVNRLVEPTSGRIFLADEDVTHVDAVRLRRRIGYVIQQVGLFPHLTVADNVATVPKLIGWDRHRVAGRVAELLELVGLEPSRFAHRYPHELSGGQRQRVGVARALGADPPVLLMDEPFGAIDPITRGRLQQEFLRLQSEVRKTVVFVTHDIDEAVLLGDRIAILRQGGVLEQHDTPAEVLGRPASPFVADFVGADRGVKRLAVTPIDVATLDRPPTVPAGESVAGARRILAAAGREWAVVVGEGDGAPVGSLTLDDAGPAGEDGAGAVLSLMQPLPATVPSTETLERALAELLQHDAAWVAVVDGDRYVGVLTPTTLHAALRRSVAAGATRPPTG